MQKYGLIPQTSSVITKEDLNQLVLCMEQLPDANTVVEGTVAVLTKPQRGYTATHYYRCEKHNGSNVWIDLGIYGPPNNEDDPEVSKYLPHAAYDYYINFHTGSVYLTGYLDVFWNQMPDHPVAGSLVYEVLVRKFGEYPTTPTDGEETVRAPKGVVYTKDKPYKYFDDLMVNGVITSDTTDIYYALFRVFKSGWWIRTCCPDSPHFPDEEIPI